MKTNPKPLEYDWHGHCDPANRKHTCRTFSVGCFQWIPRTGVKPGLKKGKVLQRFSGLVQQAEIVYAKAQAWCDEMNAWTASQ